ncbi:unnamed protein product, partial [Urochloa humidicola]
LLSSSVFPTRDSIPRRQNQSCRIVGDLAAGDAVAQSTAGDLELRPYLVDSRLPLPPRPAAAAAGSSAATGLAWSGDPSTRTCHDLFLLVSLAADLRAVVRLRNPIHGWVRFGSSSSLPSALRTSLAEARARFGCRKTFWSSSEPPCPR